MNASDIDSYAYILEDQDVVDYSMPDDLETLEDEPVHELNKVHLPIGLAEKGPPKEKQPSLSVTPPRIDELLRSFLVMNNMHKTLEAFQIEWLELKGPECVDPVASEPLLDLVSYNQNLLFTLKNVERRSNEYKSSLKNSHQKYLKMATERDYFKIQFKRMMEENERLHGMIKHLEKHYESYQPLMQNITEKYKVAMREKMINKLQRDRAISQVHSLQATVESFQNVAHVDKKASPTDQVSVNQHSKETTKTTITLPVSEESNTKKHNQIIPECKTTYKLSRTLQDHQGIISCLATSNCNSSNFCVTGGDDARWRLWDVCNGDLKQEIKCPAIGWISCANFDNLSESHLAIAGETGAVHIWQLHSDGDDAMKLVRNSPLVKLKAHACAVWSVDWNPSNQQFLTSCLDGSLKIWDLLKLANSPEYERAVCTYREEKSSINAATYLNNGQAVIAGTSTKNLLVYDLRRKIRCSKWQGHESSINSVTSDHQGRFVASCSADGVAKLWDLRRLDKCLWAKLTEVEELEEAKRHPLQARACFELKASMPNRKSLDEKKQLDLSANCIRFDMSDKQLAIGGSNGVIQLISLSEDQVINLAGHENAVNGLEFDQMNNIISASSDGTIRHWI